MGAGARGGCWEGGGRASDRVLGKPAAAAAAVISLRGQSGGLWGTAAVDTPHLVSQQLFMPLRFLSFVPSLPHSSSSQHSSSDWVEGESWLSSLPACAAAQRGQVQKRVDVDVLVQNGRGLLPSKKKKKISRHSRSISYSMWE